MSTIGNMVRSLLFKMRHPGVQLHLNELELISEEIAARPSTNLLIFGVGNDSAFWMHLNAGGRTVFLEDAPNWLRKVKTRLPHIEAYAVTYDTKMSDWRSHIGRERELLLDLPAEIRGISWDVIIVDAPAGYTDFIKLYGVEAPGRMKSIYTASRIVRDNGTVFVHDCEREIENEFSSRYLGPENLRAEVRGRALLRKYVVRR